MPVLIDGIDDEQREDELGPLFAYGDAANAQQQEAQPTPQQPVVAAAAPAQPQPQPVPAKSPYVDDKGNYLPPVYSAPDTSELSAWEGRKGIDSQVPDIHRKDVSPRWWERGLGGLVAGAMAFGKTPGALQAGQDVTNRRWNNEENQRAGRLAEDQARIEAARADIASQNQNWERGMQGFNAQLNADRANQLNADRRAQEQQRLQAIAPGTEQPDDPKNPGGSWTARTIGGQTIKLQSPPDSWLKTPQGKQWATHQEREALAASIGAKPGSDDYKFIMANGKLKEPAATTNVHVPSAEASQYEDWKRSLGHAPTAAEIEEYKRGGRPADGSGTSTPQQRQKLVEERDKAYRGLEDKYRSMREQATSDQERAEIDRQREAEKATLNAQYDARFSQLDPTGTAFRPAPQGAAATPVATAPTQAPKPAATPAARPASPPQQQQPQRVKSGAQIVVGQRVALPGNKFGIVTGFKNGKAQVRPE